MFSSPGLAPVSSPCKTRRKKAKSKKKNGKSFILKVVSEQNSCFLFFLMGKVASPVQKKLKIYCNFCSLHFLSHISVLQCSHIRSCRRRKKSRIQRVQWPIAISQTTEKGEEEKEKRDCGRFFDWDLAEEEEEGEENAQSPG